MRYLTGPDVEEARSLLQTDLPDIEVVTLRLGLQGWDNHTFILNERYVVRFPKDGESRWLQERWVLTALGDLSPIPIPKIEFVGSTTAFSGYRLLPGIRLSAGWPVLDRNGRERILDRLVEFCAVMHGALSTGEAICNGLRAEELRFDRARSYADAGGEWAEMTRRCLERIDDVSTATRVLHNDLHGDNVLVEPDSRKLTGVIDFGDVAYGDPCVDLNYLLEYDLMQADRVARRYERSSGVPTDPRRLLDLYLLLTLENFLDPETPADEVAGFRRMIEEFIADVGA